MKALAFFAALSAATQTGELFSEDAEENQSELLASWLILFAMAQTSFCAAFSDIRAALRRGAFVHAPSIPMSIPEKVVCFALNGIGCGYLAGMGMALIVAPLALVTVTYAWHFAVHSFATCLTFSLLGILCALQTKSPNPSAVLHGAAIVCLALLSIMVSSLEHLSWLWHTVARANPFFYLAEGFRYGVAGGASALMPAGLAMALAMNVTLGALCHLNLLRLTHQSVT